MAIKKPVDFLVALIAAVIVTLIICGPLFGIIGSIVAIFFGHWIAGLFLFFGTVVVVFTLLFLVLQS
jgi:hypothetical protein